MHYITSDKTAAEIREYNAQNKEGIDLGLVPAWIQSDKSKKQEAEQAKQQKAQQEEDARNLKLKEIGDKYNKEFGTECSLSFHYAYGDRGGWHRDYNNPIGVTIDTGCWNDKIKGTFRFKEDGSLNWTKIEERVKEYCKTKSIKTQAANNKESREKAGAAATNHLKDKLKDLFDVYRVESTEDLNRFNLYKLHYYPGARGYHDRLVFGNVTLDQIEQIIRAKEGYQEQIKQILENETPV